SCKYCYRLKTTVDIPESLLREAKALAASQGRTLRDFVAEAMNEKLQVHVSGKKPWMKHFGALSKLRKENRRIEKVIEKELETVYLAVVEGLWSELPFLSGAAITTLT